MTSSPSDGSQTALPRLDCFVYLTNIESSVTWKQLKSVFDVLEEPVRSLYIFDGKTERKDGIIEFDDPSVAQLAVDELNGIKVGGAHVGMRPAKIDDQGVPHSLKKAMGVLAPQANAFTATGAQATGQGKGGTSPIVQPPPNRVLFVSNIPFDMGDAEKIKALFTPFGYVEKVRLGQSEDGTFRGFGTVFMRTVAQAAAAQQALCQTDMGGRKLLVIFDKFGDSK